MNIAEFARWAVESGCWEGCAIDGGDIQDKALELGIIVETKYDPDKHGRQYLAEIDDGDTWYVFSDDFFAALASVQGK